MKALNALFQIKLRLTKQCTILTKLNAITGYIVPIATHPSPAWLLKQSITEPLKRTQNVTAKVFIVPSRSYTIRLRELKLLPLCLCVEMHNVLMLLPLIDKKYNININHSTPATRHITRQSNIEEFRLTTSRLQNTDDNFFRLTKQICKCFIRTCPFFEQRLDNTT